ncbi:MAG: creatininase family protein [Gemmatimonadales bacterium]|nr:MAG: creatininase family protein [Gemmatimonadales bacterium]
MFHLHLATHLRRRCLSADLEGTESLILEQLTWPEVELAITRGMTSVVIPVGAVEQHGPHLPLFVDAERGTALGLRVARHLGDALLAPTIRVGWSEHHMGFAGTISLRKETLEAVLRDYCESLARHGFQDIYLVPSHGGNFHPIEEMLSRLRSAVAEVSDSCRVAAYTDLLGFVSVWRWVVEEEVGLGRNVGGHADIAESSEMLFLHPGLVRMGRVEKGRAGELDSKLVARAFEKGLRSITPNGVLGDPRGMDANLGERLLDATALLVAERFREEREDEGEV